MKKILSFFLMLGAAALGAADIEFVLNPGERKSIEVNAPESAAKELRMSVTARLDAAKAGGGMLDALVMTAGNKRITAAHLSKDESNSIIFRGKKIALFPKNSRMMVVYAPGFDTTAKEARITGENIFTRKFDLGSLMTPGKKSKLTFIHPWTPQQAQRLKNPLKLFVKIKFEEVPSTEKKVAPPASAQKTAEPAANYPGEIKIAPEETHTMSFEHKANTRSILKLLARQDTANKLGGYAYVMEIRVNGKLVTNRIDRNTSVLLNRKEFFKRHNGKVVYYENAGAWLTIWSNGYTYSPRGRYGLDAPEPYLYTLDITPFAREGKNVITIKNRWSKGMGKKYPREKMLCIIPEVKSEASDKSSVNKVDLPKFPQTIDLTVEKNGLLVLPGGKPGRFFFEGAFSQPGGGFNYLSDKSSASKLWQPQVRKISQNEFEITAQNEYYTLKRTIKVSGMRIAVSDHLSNITDKSIAVRFRQQMRFPDFDLPQCRMGGNPGHSLNDYPSSGNPTIFWPGRDSAAGMVVEDDVARNQVLFFYDKEKRRSGFYNDCFMLKAKANYTVQWSIYLNKTADYYDFINQVRKDWNVNHTIKGPVYFVGVNEIYATARKTLAKHIAEKNIKYVCFWEIRERRPEAGNKFVVANGSALFMPMMKNVRDQHVAASAQWRKLFPQIKIAQYYHSFFNGFEKVDDPTYRDSWITNIDGSRIASQYSDKVIYKFQTYCPIPGNKMWDIHCKSLDFLVNDMRSGWIYWDESNGPGVTAKDFIGASPMAYNVSDGNSALVDTKTNTIIKECGSLPLLARPALRKAFDLLKQNKIDFVLFNGANATADRHQAGVYSMAETQDNISWAYTLHLSTPLAYGLGSPKFSTIVERLDYSCLYIRNHITYKSTAVSKFYPITIEEIHSGWVKGKERIVTNRSGKFGWQGSFMARIWQYDSDGKCLNENPPVNSYTDQAALQVPQKGLCILERVF